MCRHRLNRAALRRPGGRYTDRAGRDIDLARWSALFEWRRYRFVAHTRLGPVREVSTIWSGAYVPGREYRFNTCVFVDGVAGDEYWWPTEAAALAGHEETVMREFFALLRAAFAQSGIDADTAADA
jgi:hypothetical protein